MLTLHNLDIRFGDKHLFRNIALRVNKGDRIGLVGVNGAGKSTLLQIMAGLQEVDDGVVKRTKYSTIAYLPQEASALVSERTIYQEAETAFAENICLQKELEDVNRELSSLDSTSPEFAVLFQRQGDLQQRLESQDVFRVDAQIKKVLLGLGFCEAELDRPSSTLSGGWLMRLMLAKLLLAKPSLLLLDEPTNHLDLDSLTWLENFLLSYEGAMVIISHDRTFLDRSTGFTWELSLGKLTAFKGNFSQYLVDREMRLQVERAAYANQEAKVRQTMRFVQRFRAKSTKAKQVQSRLKQLAKMERVELSGSEQKVFFQFPAAAPCGRQVLEVAGVEKRYEDKMVFSDVSMQLQRGDKMGVVGVNGAGKSTLMRILAGLEAADSGLVRPGHNVVISYFGQHQAQELAPDLTVLQTLGAHTGDMAVSAVRSLLGAFLFKGDDVDKKVQVLSGGEKSRLALAKMIVRPANLLILDEPTNHLDMDSQEVLQEAMAQYDGAIIIVSHNRYFVNRFINKVLELKDGRASLFEGDIDDYLYRKQHEVSEQLAVQQAAQGVDAKQKVKTRGRAVRQEQARLRQQKSRLLGPCRKSIAETEKEIEGLEIQKKELEERMADPELYKDAGAFSECSREYGAVKRRLDRQLHKWEEVLKEMEQLEAELAALSE